jgi:rhodanese-related sulfurtransferase
MQYRSRARHRAKEHQTVFPLFGPGLSHLPRTVVSCGAISEKGEIPMTNSVDIKELHQLLAGDNVPILLDVRRKTDYEATAHKIPGAIWRDPEKIDAWVGDLPPGRPTVVYCVKGGSVSQSVADRLHKEGCEARFLQGGLKAYIENGQPVE